MIGTTERAGHGCNVLVLQRGGGVTVSEVKKVLHILGYNLRE
jgi:hypothetical protein